MKLSAATPESILEEAVEIVVPADRQAFLGRACAGNAELRAGIERLIANHFAAGDFLDCPAPNVAPAASLTVTETSGTLVGPYKLLEQIGEGGMGVVFVAEQERPVRRTVALKLIKPGMDSQQVVARFEAERQALAMMDHPNIAKVLDAGTTEAGRPYFVMELVHGIPITEYCDQGRMTIRQRLEVFVQVCRAVQHAHLKGVIHRDLKPTNVLVTSLDGVPMPIIIDFGVAKATGGSLTERTIYTAFHQFVGTPLYMSPEQAEMNAFGVDTRSDVYSLGVLLYELLTGATPFDQDRLRTAGHDEFRRILREEEPLRPSARVSTLGAALSTASDRRGIDPRRLTRTLCGELDWIVLRALEKDRTRRYETASAFAADVDRHLSDEPVEACPPSTVYRLRKFGRRHKAGLGVAASLLALLLLGGAVLWREQGQRSAAQITIQAALERADLLRQQERWEEASAVLAVALGQSEGHGLETLRQRAEQALKDVDMVVSLGTACLRRSAGNLKTFGDAEGAELLYAQAFQNYGVDLTTPDPEDAARRVRASAIRDRLIEGLDDWSACRDQNSNTGGGKTLRAISRLADSDPWRLKLREVIADREALEQLAEHQDILSKPSGSLVSIARSLTNVGSITTAGRLLRQAQAVHPADFWINFELAQILFQTKPPETEQAIRFCQAALALRPESPTVQVNLSAFLALQGRLEESVVACRRAIALKPDFPEAYGELAAVLHDQGDFKEAETASRKAIALKPDLAPAYDNLGLHLRPQGKLLEAEAAHRKAIALKPLKPDLAKAYTNLGGVLDELGRLVDAEAACRTAIALMPNLAPAYDYLGVVLHHQGKAAEAETACRRAVALEPELARAHYHLAYVLHRQGKLAEAEAACRQAIALKPDLADSHGALGSILIDQGKLAEAEAALRKAIDRKPGKPAHYTNLGIVLTQRGDPVGAVSCLREAIRLKPDFVVAHNNLAWLLATCPDATVRDPGEAVVHAMRSVDLAPENGLFWNTLGIAQYRNGDWNSTIATLTKSIELRKENDASDLFFLAMAHWQLHEKEKARAWYAQAIAWMDQHNSQDEEFKRFRDEATGLLGVAEAEDAQKKKD